MDGRISVNVDTRYLEDQSDPGESRYVFAYTITIRNRGTVPAKLLGRHWVITDANGKVQEVRSMQGSYLMLADDGERFEAPIPAFSLAIPGTIH